MFRLARVPAEELRTIELRHGLCVNARVVREDIPTSSNRWGYLLFRSIPAGPPTVLLSEPLGSGHASVHNTRWFVRY